MRWTYEQKMSLTHWHKWFAWHPVRVHGEWVWLETVERKIIFGWMNDSWEYRNV